mgnify:CR=1 FL=1
MRLQNASVALLCSVLLASAPAYASRPLEPVPHELDGRQGVWFERDDADLVLDALTRRLPAAEQTVEAQDKLVLLLRGQVRTATSALAVSDELNLRLSQTASVAWQAYEEEVESNDSLFEEPILWLIVGLVIGGGAVAAGAFATK